MYIQFQISRSSNISIPDAILRKGLREEDARQGDSFAERANAGLLFGWVQGKTRVKVSQSVAKHHMDVTLLFRIDKTSLGVSRIGVATPRDDCPY